MYVQFKHGFIEADRWDGSEIPVASHQVAAKHADVGGRGVVVVRSREHDTLQWVIACVRSIGGYAAPYASKVFSSPPGWDYEWRCYLPVTAWAGVLASIAEDLDYRNFKAWSAKHSTPNRTDLAHDIWHAAR